MKALKILLATLLTLGMLVGCGGSINNDEPSKLGGELVIYSPNSDFELDNIIPKFEEMYGVDVSVISAGTGECLTRLEAEKENPQADVMFGGINYGVYVQHPDLWEKYTSSNDGKIDEAYRQNADYPYYTNYLLSGSGALVVNKTLAANMGITIKGYADLLNPALKGKIISADPTSSSSAWAELTNMLLVMGDKAYDDKAWEYVEKLIPILDGVQSSGSSGVYKGVASGEYVVGLSYEDPCVSLVMSGADVELVYPSEGTVWLPSASAIVKNAPNMEQAKAFMDFLNSDECQTVIASENSSVRGVNSKMEVKNPSMAPWSEINVAYEDIPYVAEHKSEWQSKYADLLSTYLSSKK